ncbi:MAG: CoA-binding protein [Chelatococcus sp.]|uniref:CoA-binding protein n=1 Tax=Chelatococcus sp. TaxID=1953771 RepID=UPI0025C0471A|nr:CoA-binding protein [Chelatococcus sp.]MBX3539517.1 CoA-binding protein [Chelatococcus sp.]
MSHDNYSDDLIRRILNETRTIALIGASNNPARPSHGVMAYLIDAGYALYPVNPGLAGQLLLGREVYASLGEVPVPIDMVDVFRNSEAAGAVVDEALALPNLPKVIWMQLGVRNDAAAARAEAKGVTVIMNRCPAIERPRLLGGAAH